MHSRASLKELKQIGSIFSLFDIIPYAAINKKTQFKIKLFKGFGMIKIILFSTLAETVELKLDIETINLQFSYLIR